MLPVMRLLDSVLPPLLSLSVAAAAQSPAPIQAAAPKTHVYADLELGIATRTFSAEMDARTAAALGAAFDPGTAARAIASASCSSTAGTT